MALQEISRESWNGLLNDYSKQFTGKHARLEVVEADGKQQVITESLPFEGISADLKDGENSISIILDASENSMMTHIVSEVTRVQVDDLNGSVSRIEVESGDGTTTVLSLH